MDDAELAPVAVCDVELSAPIPEVQPADKAGRLYRRARVLVRLHTRPVGVLEIEAGVNGIPRDVLASAIWDAFAEPINQHLKSDGLDEIQGIGTHGVATDRLPACIERREALLRNGPMASVIICTRNRPTTLRRALESLGRLHYSNFEAIVVDGSADTATKDLVAHEFPDVRYVSVGRYGKSIAQNSGVALASGDIAAFTDDDVVVDPHWLGELVAAFQRDDRVACATGLAMPLELATPAQIWFEESGGFTEGYDRRVLDPTQPEPGSLLPWATGRIGAGVNMAWRRSVIHEIGFDVGLDGVGGDELSAFFDALVEGFKIVYEPGAIVYHEHRRTYAELRHQLYRHGVHLGAYLTRCLVTRPTTIPGFLRRLPRGAYYGFSPSSPRNRGKSERFPAALTWVEAAGVIVGPYAYLKNLGKTRLTRAPRAIV